MMVVVCGYAARGREVGLDGVASGRVTVVRWGEHHCCLIRLCVLMVEVDHTFAAVRGSCVTGSRN